MGKHESSVNYQNLIKDLAEMYPFEVYEVIISELIANCLDAKATRVSIDFDRSVNILVVTDNGSGMNAAQFEQYHDFAVGLKTRGKGIGFAGVGAKISFNVADRVVTETRSKTFEGGSNWYLYAQKRLLWEDIPITHLEGIGTRVEVHFAPHSVPPWTSRDDLVQLLHRHYLPLLDITFRQLYRKLGLYESPTFVVNGEEVPPIDAVEFYKLDRRTLRKGPLKDAHKKRIGLAVFGLSELEYPVAPDVCGVLLCTYGKVVKVDMLNQFPGAYGSRIFGMVEVPGLVEFLTTSKTDFVRHGASKKFADLYNPVGDAFREWLLTVGVQPAEISGTDETRALERELQRLMAELPELSLFSGAWIEKSILSPNKDGLAEGTLVSGAEPTIPIGKGSRGGGPGLEDAGQEPGIAMVPDDTGAGKRAQPISRSRRRGPKVAFREERDRVEVAWIAGDCVVVNTGHPCWEKVKENARLRKVYSLFAIATAIQRFCHGDCGTGELTFIDRMMAAWART
jgi:hypothetical protein